MWIFMERRIYISGFGPGIIGLWPWNYRALALEFVEALALEFVEEPTDPLNLDFAIR